MNEYQECVFQYIMERQYGEMMKGEEYRAARGRLKEAEDPLWKTLTKKQKKKYDEILYRMADVSTMERKQTFQDAIQALKSLAR